MLINYQKVGNYGPKIKWQCIIFIVIRLEPPPVEARWLTVRPKECAAFMGATSEPALQV